MGWRQTFIAPVGPPEASLKHTGQVEGRQSLLQQGAAVPSPLRRAEQAVGDSRAGSSQFPSLPADKFKAANVPCKMRPSEIYSSPRLAAPIRCWCQPGSLPESQERCSEAAVPTPRAAGRGGRQQRGCSALPLCVGLFPPHQTGC